MSSPLSGALGVAPGGEADEALVEEEDAYRSVRCGSDGSDEHRNRKCDDQLAAAAPAPK